MRRLLPLLVLVSLACDDTSSQTAAAGAAAGGGAKTAKAGPAPGGAKPEASVDKTKPEAGGSAVGGDPGKTTAAGETPPGKASAPAVAPTKTGGEPEPATGRKPGAGKDRPAAGKKTASKTGVKVTDPALKAAITKQFGDHCRPERVCRDMLGVDCNAAADGPYYYLKLETREVITTCGGACMMRKCTDCPPKGWDCPVY